MLHTSSNKKVKIESFIYKYSKILIIALSCFITLLVLFLSSGSPKIKEPVILTFQEQTDAQRKLDAQIHIFRDVFDDKAYFPVLIKSFKDVAQMRNFALDGFKYCSWLDGSKYDGLAKVHSLGGSVGAVNPSKERVVDMLEQAAQSLCKIITQLEPSSTLSRHDMTRFCCYAAALGNTPFLSISTSKFVQHFGDAYLQEKIPSYSKKSINVVNKPRFSLAYFIVVDDANAIRNLMLLVDTLDDGSAIFLIHMEGEIYSSKSDDPFNPWMRGKKDRVFLTDHLFNPVKGHSSMLFMQLHGYFELLDLADWDYVINLSAYDFPLRQSKQIYEYLSDPSRFGRIWTKKNVQSGILSDIQEVTIRNNEEVLMPFKNTKIFWPFDELAPCKSGRWAIYPRRLVEYVRKDEQSKNLLIFLENTFNAEEVFFCTVINNHDDFKSNNIENNKRLEKFNGNLTKWLTSNDISDLTGFTASTNFYQKPKFLFIRKIDIFDDVKFKNWIIENHLNTPKKIK